MNWVSILLLFDMVAVVVGASVDAYFAVHNYRNAQINMEVAKINMQNAGETLRAISLVRSHFGPPDEQ